MITWIHDYLNHDNQSDWKNSRFCPTMSCSYAELGTIRDANMSGSSI